MARQAESIESMRPKVLLVGVQAPYNTIANIQSYYDEFINLVRSNNIAYDEITYVKLREINPATFFTKGKLNDLIDLVKHHNIDEVIISEPLTGQQERNLRDLLYCKVYDRSQLILEIFENNADTIEGKTQVAIAMLQYKKTRLAGKGKHLAQQRGVLGLRAGFGETAKERERRSIEYEISKLKKQLERAHKTRETQRKRRLETNIPLICLIGYTNAGKSTILNHLTKSDVLAQDRLFATLDTTTRQLFIKGKKRALLSDTVGFIQLLPHKLIEAFKSTLSELQYADLLLNVVDASDPNWQDHIAVVHEILDDLNVDKPMLYVFNKIDAVELTPRLEDEMDRYQPNVMISAIHNETIQKLVDFLDWWLKNYT